MNFLIAMAQPPGGGQANPLAAFMPLILIFVIFYFLLIRPQQKKQKAQQLMLAGVKKGDKIITTGGIHGIVTNVKDNIITVKIAENVKIDLSKSCVGTIKREQQETTQ